MNTTLTQIKDIAKAIGPAAILRSAYWDGTTNLAMTHLAYTEGPVDPQANAEMDAMTLELSGPAPVAGRVKGYAPTVEFNALAANKTMLGLLSPLGSASIGST